MLCLYLQDDPVPGTPATAAAAAAAASVDSHKNRPRSLSESLHIFTSGFPVASSPSPTRVGKVVCITISYPSPLPPPPLISSPSPDPISPSLKLFPNPYPQFNHVELFKMSNSVM